MWCNWNIARRIGLFGRTVEEHSSLQNKVIFLAGIPVFNEETNLEPLYTRLTKVMKDRGKSYEIVFVADGSSHSSFEMPVSSLTCHQNFAGGG